jgi:hypothetical protein
VLTTTADPGCGSSAGRFRLLIATGITVALRVARRTRKTPGRVPWSAAGRPGTGHRSYPVDQGHGNGKFVRWVDYYWDGAALRPGRGARGSDAAHGHRGPPVDRAYLARALPSLPYGQGAQVRHVVGGAAGGGYEWTNPGAAAPRGVNVIKLNSRGQIVQLTSIWDGSRSHRHG